jgi:hypothetical protein
MNAMPVFERAVALIFDGRKPRSDRIEGVDVDLGQANDAEGCILAVKDHPGITHVASRYVLHLEREYKIARASFDSLRTELADVVNSRREFGVGKG